MYINCYFKQNKFINPSNTSRYIESMINYYYKTHCLGIFLDISQVFDHVCHNGIFIEFKSFLSSLYFIIFKFDENQLRLVIKKFFQNGTYVFWEYIRIVTQIVIIKHFRNLKLCIFNFSHDIQFSFHSPLEKN